MMTITRWETYAAIGVVAAAAVGVAMVAQRGCAACRPVGRMPEDSRRESTLRPVGRMPSAADWEEWLVLRGGKVESRYARAVVFAARSRDDWTVATVRAEGGRATEVEVVSSIPPGVDVEAIVCLHVAVAVRAGFDAHEVAHAWGDVSRRAGGVVAERSVVLEGPGGLLAVLTVGRLLGEYGGPAAATTEILTAPAGDGRQLK